MIKSVKKAVGIRDELNAKLGLDVRSLAGQVKVIAEAKLNSIFGGNFHAGRVLSAYAKQFAEKIKGIQNADSD